MRLLLLLLSCLAGAAQAGEFSARVIAVLDGDTVLVRQANTLTKIRLAGIDAPEVGHAGMGGQPPNSQQDQPYGMEAKQSLSDMVLNKQVQIKSQAVDDYGRLVANLSADGRDVNAEQLRRGMAWEYSWHHGNQAYVALQHEAQQARRGLWAQADPVQPSLWRKSHASSAPPKTAARDDTCGKQHCSQMASCEEAKYYFTHCHAQLLDGDGDGKPCENLCAAETGLPPRR